MREIIFRGKRIDNGEWVEGYYYRSVGRDIIAASCDHIVDPSTVGQYVGLSDTNGKKIFEGDIVKVENTDHDWHENTDHDWHEHDPNSYSVFAVSFDEGGFTAGDYFLQYWLWYDGFHGEVIGNFHDNPELLEVTT